MNDQNLPFLLQQLAYQTPGMIVCLVGMVVALVFLNRSPNASVLVLVGCGLLLVTGLSMSVAQWYLLQRRVDEGWDMEHYANMMGLVSVSGTLLRTIGLAALVGAAFVGRHQPASEPRRM